MQARRVSQQQLAEALDCTRGAVGHYLAGRRNPSLQQLETMAKLLLVDPRWLVFGDDPRSVREDRPGTSPYDPLVPITGTTAGAPSSGRLNLAYCSDRAYGLKVEGDRWAPRLQEGEIVVICPKFQVAPGDEVLVTFADGNIDFLMLVRRQKDRVTLESLVGERKRRIYPLGEIQSIHCVSAVFRGAACDALEDSAS
jgi:transcriptional regulator with XRE-family HTH domain